MRVGDLIRNLLYPAVPAVGVACLWAYAWAGCVEAAVNKNLGPIDPLSLRLLHTAEAGGHIDSNLRAKIITAAADSG